MLANLGKFGRKTKRNGDCVNDVIYEAEMDQSEAVIVFAVN